MLPNWKRPSGLACYQFLHYPGRSDIDIHYIGGRFGYAIGLIMLVKMVIKFMLHTILGIFISFVYSFWDKNLLFTADIQKTCPICVSSEFVEASEGEIKIPCNTNNIGYRWICLTCKNKDILKVYEGETDRSARICWAEHVKDIEGMKPKRVKNGGCRI